MSLLNKKKVALGCCHTSAAAAVAAATLLAYDFLRQQSKNSSSSLIDSFANYFHCCCKIAGNGEKITNLDVEGAQSHLTATSSSHGILCYHEKCTSNIVQNSQALTFSSFAIIFISFLYQLTIYQFSDRI